MPPPRKSVPSGSIRPLHDDLTPAELPPIVRPARAPEPAVVPVPPSERSYPYVLMSSVRWGPVQFASSVAERSQDARPGDVVTIYGPDNEYVGRGIYNPASRYAVRVLTRVDEPVDDAWFRSKLADAVALRRELLSLDATTSAYRLINSEGDGLSGLIVDRYAEVLSVECYSLGMWRLLPTLVTHLAELTGCTHVHAQMDERIRAAERVAVDEPPPAMKLLAAPGAVEVREHQVRFRVRFGFEHGGHKTGFFCDQRDNRRRFAELARARRLLDVCCYSGGFACTARKLAGVEEAVGVDLDERAIAIARENANLNQLRIRWVHADAFSYMRQMQTNAERFGAIVVDPPKLVTTPAEAREGRQKYIDLNKLACSIAEPGAVLLSCSCSGLVPRDEFVKLVCDAARYAGRRLQLLDVTGASADHPVMADYPEGAYLKAVWARVL